MSQAKFLIVLLIIFHLAGLSPPPARAEYNLATQEEELILISSEKEVEMGRSLSKKVEQRFGLDNDVLLQKRIDSIGQNIARVCDRKDISYHFKVLVGEDLKAEQRINAFALPGGYIYLTRGLMAYLNSEAELAAVLGHEIGHVAARHAAKTQAKSHYFHCYLPLLL